MKHKYPFTPHNIFKGKDGRYYWHYDGHNKLAATDRLVHWKCPENPHHKYEMSIKDFSVASDYYGQMICPVCAVGEWLNNKPLSMDDEGKFFEIGTKRLS